MAATLDISRPTLHVPTDAFRNEPLTDFSNSETARRMQEALSKVRAELGREYDMVIGEKLIRTTEKITSTNPAKPSEVIGIFQSAGKEHVEMAIAAATTAFESWKRTSVEQRASMIHAVAGILRERKFEFAAWMVYGSARTGLKPMPISRRRSTLPNFMRAKRCGCPSHKRRCNCPVSMTRLLIFRLAWAQ